MHCMLCQPASVSEKAQGCIQKISSFVASYLPSKVKWFISYPSNSKLALIYSLASVTITSTFLESLPTELCVGIGLTWITVYALNKYLFKYGVFRERLSQSQSFICIVGPTLTRIVLDFLTQDLQERQIINESLSYLTSGSLVVIVSMINSKKRAQITNEQGRIESSALASFSDNQDRIECGSKTPIEIDAEEKLLYLLAEIEELEKKIKFLSSLIEENPRLKELFEKHLKDYPCYFASVNVEKVSVSLDDTIFKNLEAASLVKLNCEYALKEFKIYINFYKELKECFLEILSKKSEENNFKTTLLIEG